MPCKKTAFAVLLSDALFWTCTVSETAACFAAFVFFIVALHFRIWACLPAADCFLSLGRLSVTPTGRPPDICGLSALGVRRVALGKLLSIVRACALRATLDRRRRAALDRARARLLSTSRCAVYHASRSFVDVWMVTAN